MKFIKKYVKNLDWEKLSDFSFYSLLVIYVICAMSFGAYLNNGIIKPTLTSLLFLIAVFSLLTFTMIQVNKIIFWFYKKVISIGKLDQFGLIKDEDKLTYYYNISSFKKYFFWQNGPLILLSFVVTYPVSKLLEQEYNLMYFSIIILITDYFLKYFSLSWARKNRPQKMKINMVWESSKIEFIFVTILQIVITPLLIFNFIHIDLSLYLLEIETIKNSIFLLNIVGIFGFTFLIFPILLSLLAKKNYRLMFIIDFYFISLPSDDYP